VHYAGLFDPKFGDPRAGGEGSKAVLEVRSHELPFVIEDGQVVRRLAYERLTGPPERLYGSARGSPVLLPTCDHSEYSAHSFDAHQDHQSQHDDFVH